MEDGVATERRDNFVGFCSGDVAFVQDSGRELRTRYAVACGPRILCQCPRELTEGTRSRRMCRCLFGRGETGLSLLTSMNELRNLFSEETLCTTRFT